MSQPQQPESNNNALAGLFGGAPAQEDPPVKDNTPARVAADATPTLADRDATPGRLGLGGADAGRAGRSALPALSNDPVEDFLSQLLPPDLGARRRAFNALLRALAQEGTR